MKIFLTGNKGVGKSTCINEIIKECVLSVCGFQTLPFYEDGKRKGFYMHALSKVEKNDIVFSIQKETYNEVIPGVFNTFGVEVLTKSKDTINHYLLLDEIGFLEKEEHLYLKTLFACIDVFPNIIGVLKKCEIQYILEIKKREDIILLDFDELSYNEIKNKIKFYVEGNR